jgi:uncharacterized protein (TIGR02145 family)
MKTDRFLLVVNITLAMAFTQSFAQQKESFTDPRDKKTYKTVKIGEQTWMAENLDYHGGDGSFGLCYPENCKKYGRLYDWKEALEACPIGWHLPTKDEWQKLSDFVGGDDVAGKKLKSKSGWTEHKYKEDDEIDDRGRTTDEYGFSALPGGRGNSDGSFISVGNDGYWWSANEYKVNYAYYRYMYYNHEGAFWYFNFKSFLYSVRCLQD